MTEEEPAIIASLPSRETAEGRPAAGMAAARRRLIAGLVGSGIAASRTPAMHEREGEAQGLCYTYRLLDIDRLGTGAVDLGALLDHAQFFGFSGLNVTHPCKQVVLRHLDELSPDAAAIGAVNTVVLRDGRRVGHNTDCTGFAASFRRDMEGVALDRVLLLGAGGGGAAVAHALICLGVGHLSIFDPDLDKATALQAGLAARFGSGRASVVRRIEAPIGVADGLVNAAPIGMAKYPGMPIEAKLLRPDLWVADIIYFPAETELLKAAKVLGCRTMSGEGMALFQAVDAFRLITGLEPDVERMRRHFVGR